jgi:hypothetical protein
MGQAGGFMAENDALTISFVTTEGQLAQVDEHATAEDRNRSSMLRKLIDLGLLMLRAQNALLVSGDYLHLNGAEGSPMSMPGDEQ